MFSKEVNIYLENRFCEHPYGEVDQLQLHAGEANQHLAEQCVGQLHIVETVSCVLVERISVEVFAPHADCMHNLIALHTNAIVLRKFRQ